MTINPFPRLSLKKEDGNPAIQLFGRRFEKDQTAIEYLAEFLLVFVSEKEVGTIGKRWAKEFPDIESLNNWPEDDPELLYHAHARLVLKLFSFLSSSKLETRHQCHQKHFKVILETLQQNVETGNNIKKEQVMTLLEQVLVGFVGIAQNRTWCTHTFLPISTYLISGETIWRNKEGKKDTDLTWKKSIKNFSNYYEFSKHRFMARGGELLFLQLCNLFRKNKSTDISTFIKDISYNIYPEELKHRLEKGLSHLLSSVSALDSLSQWIENADPAETAKETDKNPTTCGWCPEESWHEAYLFACEMLNICEAAIDPLEKIEMLKFCCVFQVLRSLCAQSVRYWEDITEEEKQQGGINGFSWFVTDPETKSKPIKDAGKANLARIQKLLHGALRNPDIKPSSKGYRIADEQGQGLFIKLGKQIGFIAPITGAPPRFVMPETLLRYFVLSLIPPGNRMRLKTFKETLYKHFGIAIGGEQLKSAMQWTYPKQSFSIHAKTEEWFEEKLRATGFLIPLSDSVSLVINPFSKSNL